MNLGKIRYASKQKSNILVSTVIPCYTDFCLPVNGKNQAQEQIQIQDIFRLLWKDEKRNDTIIKDIMSAYNEGREVLVLSERLEHLAILGEALKSGIDSLFVLKGGMGKKQIKSIMDKIRSVPPNKNRVILSTGKYLGEGFDLPCLDTLFLVFPFSWRGTLIQYTGRLNRDFAGKKDIRIYDYVDAQVSVLQRMYNRRLKGYNSLGFSVK
jgi:superfamily II DNA or RNA helicase